MREGRTDGTERPGPRSGPLLSTCVTRWLPSRSSPVASPQRSRLVPGLDETNRRQFRGCVEDFMIDHLQIDVIDMTQIT